MSTEWTGTVCPALIVLDLDGTLLRSDRTISERTIAALRACDLAGMQLTIASTRGAAAIELVAPPILTNALWIAHNGALITRASTVLHSFPLPHDALTAMIEFAYRFHPPALLVAEVAHCPCANHDVSALWGTGFHTVDFRMLGAVEVSKVLIRWPHDVELTELGHILPRNVVTLLDRDGFVTVNRANVSKHRALTTYLTEIGRSWSDVCAFGDDSADQGMLSAAGISVAMGNALPCVKACAKHLTASNDEDGVALFLERLLGKG